MKLYAIFTGWLAGQIVRLGSLDLVLLRKVSQHSKVFFPLKYFYTNKKAKKYFTFKYKMLTGLNWPHYVYYFYK